MARRRRTRAAARRRDDRGAPRVAGPAILCPAVVRLCAAAASQQRGRGSRTRRAQPAATGPARRLSPDGGSGACAGAGDGSTVGLTRRGWRRRDGLLPVVARGDHHLCLSDSLLHAWPVGERGQLQRAAQGLIPRCRSRVPAFAGCPSRLLPAPRTPAASQLSGAPACAALRHARVKID